MLEFVQNHEEMFIIAYCFILLWINIDYLREHKQIKEGLKGIQSEDELDLNPHSFSIFVLIFTFNFFRRWFIYIIAVLVTESLVVAIITCILFIISLYDCLFHNRLEKVKTSKIALYLAIIDTVLIAVFVCYLFI
ncbi:hypothetical protein [Halalkalibacter hemicellulosilyticus]|uniref:Uncharacterized protein n=1 Tax=Halalkalibacter hemicellulosilyticusJCM 9152 TaxID=1236971 RepID=W4QBM5_9BACI|nr:hypothetical protein [Halalkalibacter hemicellulosilyticus]GAE28804.1 hypothetical protein JCM9152_138 [Halalkalibacter hemicellulosilyticusJCM 9152]